MYNSKYEQKINMEIYYEGLQPMLIAMYVYCFNHHYQNIDINVKIYKNAFKNIDKKEKTQEVALKSFNAIKTQNMKMY